MDKKLHLILSLTYIPACDFLSLSLSLTHKHVLVNCERHPVIQGNISFKIYNSDNNVLFYCVCVCVVNFHSCKDATRVIFTRRLLCINLTNNSKHYHSDGNTKLICLLFLFRRVDWLFTIHSTPQTWVKTKIAFKTGRQQNSL